MNAAHPGHAEVSGVMPDDEALALALARSAFGHARTGEVEALLRVLDLGLPVDACNEKGDSLLMLASYHGHEPLVRALLERHADSELQNDRGQSPLAGAAFKGERAIVELLLEHGAAVDGASPDGKTPLMFAAMFNRVEVLRVLLARGADPSRTDAGGARAIDLARAMGGIQAAVLLETATS